MSYNVENLFDTEHDQQKNDYEFLPRSHKRKEKGCAGLKSSWRRKSCLKTDWTEKKLVAKLKQIKRVVDYADKPEILGLVEVENKKVVERLAKLLGYDGVVVTNGLDGRGVDVALLYLKSKLPLTFKSFKQYNIEQTRSILQVTFTSKKNDYHFFVNHWPSQRSPAQARFDVAGKLSNILANLGDQDKSIVMGDFNTVPGDHPHPFHDRLLKGGSVVDLANLRDQKKSPPGTYFYPKKMAWNFFDRIFVSSNLMKQVKSFEILHPPFLTGVFEYKRRGEPLYGSRIVGIPKKYNFKTKNVKKMGFSDHFAVIATVSGI